MKKILTLAITAALLSACASVSEQQMNFDASQAFNDIKASGSVSKDKAQNAYVKCIVNNLVKQLPTEYSSTPWEVVVLNSPEWNAFAMPGGKVAVFTGLLKDIKQQDQLAAVLSHEISHVTLKHSFKRASNTETVSMIAGLASAAADYGISQNTHLGANGSAVAKDLADQTIVAGAKYGAILPFSRSNETEADISGQILMAKAGFNPEAAVEVWRAQAAGTKASDFTSTHPSDDKREANLTKNLTKTSPLFNEAKANGIVPNCGGKSSKKVKK